jgi:hypothetical protein
MNPVFDYTKSMTHGDINANVARQIIQYLGEPMSDFDNIREDRNNAKEEREELVKTAAIEYYAENWMDAVTKSPEQSHGTFASVIDYEASKLRHSGYVYRKPKATDVFVERMVEGDFMEQAAQILIDLHAKGSMPDNAKIRQLFDDMADSYAEFQYESKLKD